MSYGRKWGDSMPVVDLFCGCGGLSKGFELAGFSIVAAFDSWQSALTCYNANFNHNAQFLDLNDVDFRNGGIKIRRKGGDEAVVYFGSEVEDALLDYMDERKHKIPATGHEDALFLSMQNKRLGVRSVEKLVKK